MVAYQLLFDKRAKQLPGKAFTQNPSPLPAWPSFLLACAVPPLSRERDLRFLAKGGDAVEEPPAFPDLQGASLGCCSAPASRAVAGARRSLQRQLGGGIDEAPLGAEAASAAGAPFSDEGSAASPPFASFEKCRWKLGVEATLDGPILITAVRRKGREIGFSPSAPFRWESLGYSHLAHPLPLIVSQILNTLKACEYEWRLLSSYKLHCRPVRPAPEASSGEDASFDLPESGDGVSQPQPGDDPLALGDSVSSVVLGIQLYRLVGSRYVIDIVLLEGDAIGGFALRSAESLCVLRFVSEGHLAAFCVFGGLALWCRKHFRGAVDYVGHLLGSDATAAATTTPGGGGLLSRGFGSYGGRGRDGCCNKNTADWPPLSLRLVAHAARSRCFGRAFTKAFSVTVVRGVSLCQRATCCLPSVGLWCAALGALKRSPSIQDVALYVLEERLAHLLPQRLCGAPAERLCLNERIHCLLLGFDAF